MCGRYTLRTPLAQVAQYFDVRDTVELPPRYNIAPTQDVPVVRLAKHENHREFAPLRWGLIPSWAKDPGVGGRNINARGETVSEKPTFRNGFQRRRCLIPADGFYEWKDIGGRQKQPHFIRLKSDEPFAFAGLWEIWGPPGAAKDETVHSFAIITTDANELLKPLHDRMPVILSLKAYEEWLDRDNQNTDQLQQLLRPFPAGEMEHFAVSTHVNSPKYDDTQCVQPVAEQKSLFD